MGATMQIQCCVERPLEEGGVTPLPDKEHEIIKPEIVKMKPAIPWYGNALPPPLPPRIVTTLPRTVSNATTVPN